MNEREITWSNIMILAGRYDAQHQSYARTEAAQAPGIWLGEPEEPRKQSYFSDATTQSDPITPQEYRVWHSSPLDSMPGKRVNAGDSHTRSSGNTWQGGRSSMPERSAHDQEDRGGSTVRRVQFREQSDSSLEGTCHYCHKRGHFMRDCRRRLDLCLTCGASDHHIVDCPKRRTLSHGNIGIMTSHAEGFSAGEPQRTQGRRAKAFSSAGHANRSLNY